MQTSTEAVNSTYKQERCQGEQEFKVIKVTFFFASFYQSFSFTTLAVVYLFVCFFAKQLNRSFTAKDSKLS